MRYLLILLFMVAMKYGYGQQPAPVPYFFSTIVNDLEKSSRWYRDVLSLAITKTEESEAYGYKLAILNSEKLMVELMELKAAVPSQELLAGRHAETRIQGHFKVGFKIENMDEFLIKLKKLGITVGNVWKDETSGKRNFLIQDPDGNLIQFFE